MEIRDPVHGSVHILEEETPVILDNFFQRLRNIKQLGFSEYIFPGATHTRFLHGIGVMYIGQKVFDKLFGNMRSTQEFERLRQTFKMACLLHDIGHAPLSHATELVMPPLKDLGLPKRFLIGRDPNERANHEDYTIKLIVDSSFVKSFSAMEKRFGLERQFVADLIVGHTDDASYFKIDGIDFFPVLHQLVSSELDCDRMDYLLRDSYFCGVSYGNYDLDWLIDNLESCVISDRAYLGISERAVVTFDDFLISRFHMFLMVYFHYRSVCLEQLLLKYFKTAPSEYTIPASIEEYVHHDDYYLMKVLRNSENKYARSIVGNNIPQKIFESFNEGQLAILEEIQAYLETQHVEYIRCSSTGRLSKYHQQMRVEDSIKVVRTIKNVEGREYINIEDATDLFVKFSKSHAVNRLHCDLSLLAANQQAQISRLMRVKESS